MAAASDGREQRAAVSGRHQRKLVRGTRRQTLAWCEKTWRDCFLPHRKRAAETDNNTCFPEQPPAGNLRPRRARTGQRELAEEMSFEKWSVSCHEHALLPGRHE